MEHRIINFKAPTIREEGGKRYLDGYFSVFNEEYRVWDGWVETIAPGAFARYLATRADTKVLWNHDSSLVLGSTENGTATLREDEHGLFGSVEINENDQEAVNAFARIARGDVTGCSFGFDIARQEEWWDENGIYRTKIIEVDPLYEVSPCTFPAYSGTSIFARNKEDVAEIQAEYEKAREKRREAWKSKMLKKIGKGE